MKKTGLLLTLALALSLLTGCSETEITLREKTYTAQETVTAVAVDARDREIRVVAGDGPVALAYYESDTEYFDITVENGVLTMAAKSDKEIMDYVGGNAEAAKRVITLTVPREGLSSLSLTTTNEDIVLDAPTLGEGLTAGNNNGDIRFDALAVGERMDLTVKNGDITGTVDGGWDDFAITCAIKKGDTTLPEEKAGGEKSLTVSANNGDVEIDFAP